MAEREYDFELIMALAEGTLPADQAAAAEAALDDAAREELELQRLAIAALREIPEPSLSGSERHELRASVQQAIGLPAAPAPAAREPARAPWLVRLLPALAGLGALVLVVGIGVRNIGGGDSDDAALPDSEQTIAATAAESAPLAAEVAEAAADDGAAEARTSSAAAEPTPTTLAPSESPAAAEDALTEEELAAGADAALPPYAHIGDLNSSTPGLLGEAVAAYQERTGSYPLDLEVAGAHVLANNAQCWSAALEAVPDALQLLAAGHATWDGAPAEIYEFITATDNSIVVILRADCSVAEQIVR